MKLFPLAMLVLIAMPIGLILEDFTDQMYLHVMSFARMLRIISDDAYDKAVGNLMKKYESKLRELERLGRMDEEYREIRERYEKFAEMYAEETDNDLEIVDYSIDAGVASVTIKNVDDEPIDYVTGFIKVIEPSGSVSEFKAQFPIPLNLQPNETRTYFVKLDGWDSGTYTIHAKVWRWNGDKILETTIAVTI